MRWTRHLSLVQQLDQPQAAAFARLSPTQRQALRDLTLNSTQRLNLYLLEDRLLVVLPPSHPAGDLELLLDDRQGRLVVFHPERRLRAVLPVEQLPDVLDRAESSRRDAFELVSGEKQTEALAQPAGGRLLPAPFSAQVRLSYAAPVDQEPDRPLLLTLTGQGDLSVGPQPNALALWTMALPLLAGDAGSGLLERLCAERGSLRGWQLRVADLSRPSAAPAAFETIVDDQRYVLLPQDRLAVERAGYSEIQTLPAPGRSGSQVAATELLGRLRAATSTAPLIVRNKSTAAAQIYLDGALLGWVAAGKSMPFKGQADGYYRLLATSPSGALSWGPVDSYIPGTLTLR